nr:ATP-binding cassette domain-containing protein [Streptomyces sp. NRRL WC-3549]
MPLLELNDLHQGYRGKPVVRGISLTLGAGAYGLLGPNGAGKSTLLRTVATADRPTSGDLRLFGEEVRTGRQLRAWATSPRASPTPATSPSPTSSATAPGFARCRAGAFRRRRTRPWNASGSPAGRTPPCASSPAECSAGRASPKRSSVNRTW